MITVEMPPVFLCPAPKSGALGRMREFYRDYEDAPEIMTEAMALDLTAELCYTKGNTVTGV